MRTDERRPRCLQVKGEWKEALLCCQDALAVKPTNADVLFRMGMLYKERNLSMDDKWFAIVSGQSSHWGPISPCRALICQSELGWHGDSGLCLPPTACTLEPQHLPRSIHDPLPCQGCMSM